MAESDQNIVDLRSDTVTRPTPAMRRAMAEAEVGDDVFGEDPTINRLQARAAEVFEKEAALFVPSGSMGNLLAIKTWTKPGMEVICEELSHINRYEMAAMSAIAGCLPRTTSGPSGVLTWDLIAPLIPMKTYYLSQPGLVSLENTNNLHGGSVYPLDKSEEVCNRAHEIGLPVHLDGARIFNAALALGRTVAELTRKFDSVMFSLSKALGAPVGSLLLGSKDFIAQARVGRKLLGGGMRQAGVLGAAGLIALEEGPKNLPRDHENAQRLSDGLARIEGVAFLPGRVSTNIVRFDLRGTGRTAVEFTSELRDQKIVVSLTGEFTIRMVTHLDVDRAGIDRTIEASKKILAKR